MTRPGLTIAVLTVNRPEAVEHCLDHLEETVRMDYECVVIDSSQDHEMDYSEWDVGVIRPPKIVGPAEAQQLAVDACQTDYLMPIADDVAPDLYSVEMLFDRADSPECDIATGILVDGDEPRSTGRRYFIVEQDGRDVLCKERLGVDYPIQVHEGDLFCADVSVFDDVSFDTRFEFHFDMWDFFLHCFYEDITVMAYPDATFRHLDFEYESPVLRDGQDKWNAASLFNKKWGLWPETVTDFTGPKNQRWITKGDLK